MAKPNTALLLTGGGARAAYQVGVLKAVAELYPRNLGIPFPILCGTSAGALNITALACYASCFHLGVRKLEWVWRRFETHHIFDFHPCQLLWRTLYQGSAGLISPQSNPFFQGRAEHQPWERARRRGLRTLLTSDHLLASAALPFVFPATPIGDRFYGDGSIHQLSPLSPAIHLGAERILLVTLDSPHQGGASPHQSRLTSSNIASHLLNTVFSDTLNSDLERLGRINQTLSLIPPRERNRLKLRQVETCVIRPSQDLDLIALDYLPKLPTQLRRLLRVLGVNGQESSSLASFLMFHPGYCQQLIRLGYQDAMAQRQHIESFLDIEERIREEA